jgi:hypothetical protein
MKSLTKFLTGVTLALGLTACGGPGFIGTTAQQQQQGGVGTNSMTGVLTPMSDFCGDPRVMGVGWHEITVSDGTLYPVSFDSSQQAIQTIDQLAWYSRCGKVNVRFIGQIVQDPCRNGPTQKCPAIRLQQIQPI